MCVLVDLKCGSCLVEVLVVWFFVDFVIDIVVFFVMGGVIVGYEMGRVFGIEVVFFE